MNESRMGHHELNGAQPVANVLERGEYANLTVCAGDDDWYAIALGADQRLQASVIYQQNEGDVEPSPSTTRMG